MTQERLRNLALMRVHKDIAATVVDHKKNSCSTLLAEILSVLVYLAISAGEGEVMAAVRGE